MFSSYLELGFEHILDPNGLDHVLFLAVLSAPFLLRDWKRVVMLATAFTVGHSITLALSSLDILSIPSKPIEILIAASILFMAIVNLLDMKVAQMKKRYLVAALFGLIHGMGFSNFFKTILGRDEVAVPLLAFNIGVELAQVVIVIVILLLSSFFIEKINLKRKNWIFLVSIPVAIYSIILILERL